MPILVINDSPIKQFAENEHAVGQSALESYLRITNKTANGERVTVFGYGSVGRGVAANFRGAYAKVSVVERDPVLKLRAHLDGFDTPTRDEALASADLIITVTGARNVITAADLAHLRDGAVLPDGTEFALYKPVIAAINGICAAGGMEMMWNTDLRVVSEDAWFQLAEPRRGLFPGGGSTVHSARQLSWCNAMEVLLLADRITPLGWIALIAAFVLLIWWIIRDSRRL